MSYLLDCPTIGKRHVSEFTYGGEYKERPSSNAAFKAWVDYVFFRDNPAGKTLEWWFHRATEQWFLAVRDTTNNIDHTCFLFEDREKFLEQEDK